MTSVRRMEARLRAWRSFRGIARASRTLAAARALHWAEHARRVEHYLAWSTRLAAAYGFVRRPEADVRVCLAIGTDVGLCGPLNAKLAEALRASNDGDDASLIVVGERLLIELGAPEVPSFPAPTSFSAVEALAAELETLLQPWDPFECRLRIIVSEEVEADGHPRIGVWDESHSDPPPLPSGPAELTPVREGRREAARLLRHARITAALVRGAMSEAEARWRTMARAHDAADRRITEQQRVIRKLRQESITQEMLEARLGRAQTST